MTAVDTESSLIASVTAPRAIVIEQLVKCFGPTRALDGLDLDVRRGEVHGFLGPNGSGKTTTLRLLLGLLRADGGSVRMLGGDPWRDAVSLHRRIAYVPGEVSLWRKLTGGETIDLFGRLRGDLDRRRVAELIDRFELDPTKRGRDYSKGNRQKVALVAALASDAELFLLDEPTAGLDPLMEAVFQACIRSIRADGRTVLLSSHILAEAEALCDRVTIIRSGRAVESGTMSALRHLTSSAVDAVVAGPVPALADLDGVHDLRVDGPHVRCAVDAGGLPGVIALLSAAGLRELRCAPPTLEDVFLRHYGDELARDLRGVSNGATR